MKSLLAVRNQVIRARSKMFHFAIDIWFGAVDVE